MNGQDHVASEQPPVDAVVAHPLSRKELIIERVNKLVDLLRADTPVCEALTKAGWPPRQARKGWPAVPHRVIELLMDGGMKFERIGDALIKAPSKLEKRVIGAMHERMVNGDKDGVNAAKVLTTHKSISAQFVQDAGANVLVIQAPNEWQKPTAPAKPAIDALPPADSKLPEYE